MAEVPGGVGYGAASLVPAGVPEGSPKFQGRPAAPSRGEPLARFRRARISSHDVQQPSPAARKPAAPPTPECQVADSLSAACLLALTGGVLDAFLYVAHGRVFAGAMTGNVVLCGIALFGGGRQDILHHALPVAAFLCGVWFAEVLGNSHKRHAVTIALVLECTGLLAASFAQAGFPENAFIFLIAFLAAFQIASFRTADSYSYSSTFITGDLRSLVTGLYKGTRNAKREGLREARDLGAIVGCFLLGAVAGALLVPRLANHTLWLPVLALSIVFAMALRRSLQLPAAQPDSST
ncbi:MAG TPA: YoaK family protein [Acidobacteriaceae bacterium]|nr:YoaK family protein [Acidobacteriaceae bacterium]